MLILETKDDRRNDFLLRRLTKIAAITLFVAGPWILVARYATFPEFLGGIGATIEVALFIITGCMVVVALFISGGTIYFFGRSEAIFKSVVYWLLILIAVLSALLFRSKGL